MKFLNLIHTEARDRTDPEFDIASRLAMLCETYGVRDEHIVRNPSYTLEEVWDIIDDDNGNHWSAIIVKTDDSVLVELLVVNMIIS